jgi:hypothetical protein
MASARRECERSARTNVEPRICENVPVLGDASAEG